MFATVVVETGMPRKFITLPQVAISFNTFGEVIFIIKDKGKDKKGRPTLIVNQRFVTTGETRGDQIAVVSGLKEGELVVTSGQLKIKNGSRVIINNAIQPKNDPAPHIVES